MAEEVPHGSTGALGSSAESLGFSAEGLVFELLAEGMAVEIPVTGASMSPFIRGLDVLSLAPLDRGAIARGDVVAFPRPGGRMVVHRVVAATGDQLLTRGDAAPQPDAWIAAAMAAGRVESVARRGRLVRWGLGPEAPLIAWLSRFGLLAPLLRPVRWLVRRGDAR